MKEIKDDRKSIIYACSKKKQEMESMEGRLMVGNLLFNPIQSN